MSLPASINDLYMHVLATVELYAMNTSLFESSGTDPDVVVPSNLALYLFGLFYSHIARVGTLSGDNKNDVCPTPDDLVVPLGFAKYLEHLGPYSDGPSKITSTASLGAQLASTTPFFGLSQPEHFWGATILTEFPSAPKTQFYPYEQSSLTLSEFTMSPEFQAIQLKDLWSVYASEISESIAEAGLSCVRYKDIPKTAPNASAYAICLAVAPIQSVLPSSGQGMWSCFSNDYSPEEANIFRGMSTLGDYYGLQFQKPVIQCTPLPAFDLTFPAATQTPAAFSPFLFNAWIASRQKSYKPGPICKSYLLCETKVKSLCFTLNLISVAAITRVAAAAANEFLRQTTIAPTDDDLTRIVWMYYHVLAHLVVARVNMGSPFHTICASNQSSTVATPDVWSPQSSYVSRDWISLPVPAVIARFADSIGPVNVDGHVTCPVFLSMTSASNPNYSDGTIVPAFSLGNFATVLRNSTLFSIGNTGLSLLSGSLGSLNFAPTGSVIGTAQIQNFYGNGLAYQRGLFANYTLPYLANVWDRLHKKFFSGVGMSSSLIHMHNPICGSSSAMLTKVSQVPSSDYIVPDQGVTSGFLLSCSNAEARLVTSYVNLSADEIVEAVMYRFAGFIPDEEVAAHNARYKYMVPGLTSSTQLLQSYAVKTFSPDSSFARAISEKEAQFQPVIANVAGVEIVDAAEEGCWVRDLLKTVGRETFNALRYATPTAAGMVCNYFIPGSSSFCASGAEKVIDSVGSYIGVESDGHVGATKKDVAEAKKVVTSKEEKKKKARKPIVAPSRNGRHFNREVIQKKFAEQRKKKNTAKKAAPKRPSRVARKK
jgi:hypothetical protein